MTLPSMGLAQRLMLLGMLAVVLSTTVGGLLLREQLHAVILRGMAGSLGERATALRPACASIVTVRPRSITGWSMTNSVSSFPGGTGSWKRAGPCTVPARSGTAGWKHPPTSMYRVLTCCCSPAAA